MKKPLIYSVMILFGFFFVVSAFAGTKCPQPRKTKAAPGSLITKKIPPNANAAAGKKLFMRTAKPMACKMCHGEKGDGNGKLGAALKPRPRNFTCAETMKKVSAGQIFYIIKNGSIGTGMVAHGRNLSDKQIWDITKFIRSEWVDK